MPMCRYLTVDANKVHYIKGFHMGLYVGASF